MEFQSSTGGTPGQGVGCIRHETGLPAPEPVPVPVAVVATEALGEWRDPAAAAAAIATAVAAAVAVAAPVTASPKRAWRMPVVAEEEATCRGPKRNRRNDWHRSHGPRARPVTAAPLLVPGEDRESRATLSTRTRASAKPDARNTRDGCRASAGRPPGEGRPNLLQRCPAPARTKRRIRWRRPPGEARHSHQAGRRDARRWPRSPEQDECFTPPQGGEPERRRDQRRTRRQAGEAEYQVQRQRQDPSERAALHTSSGGYLHSQARSI
jgi:hypothetical protein